MKQSGLVRTASSQQDLIALALNETFKLVRDARQHAAIDYQPTGHIRQKIDPAKRNALPDNAPPTAQ